MTTTNHALAGAIIAQIVPIPGLAVLLAFFSHFVMDALPHFGIPIQNDDVWARNNRTIFKFISRLDTVITFALFVISSWLSTGGADWKTVFACMFAAIFPDLVWVYRFIKEQKTHKVLPKSWFSKFHAWLQWGERPWGWVIEAVWFFASLAVLWRLMG
jgi:hypothetical protein